MGKKVPKRRRNGAHESVAEKTFSAIGLGVGVVSVGVALGNIYRRPSLSVGSAVLGFGLMAWHLPWDELAKSKKGAG